MTSIRLEDQLCFAIYSAEHAFSRAYKPLLDELGITYPQLLVLMVLWSQDGQTVNEIGQKLMLESSTLTPLLKRMEGRKLITRVRHEADERHVRITLTAGGSELARSACDVRTCVMSDTGLSPETLARLKREIEAVRDRLLEARKRS